MLEKMALQQMEDFFVGKSFDEICDILGEEKIDFHYDEPDEISLAFISIPIQGWGEYHIEFDENDISDSSYMSLWED